MSSRVNRKNNQEIELHGLFKDAARNNLPGSPDADRKVKIACTLRTGETAFRALQFRNVSSFRPPRPYVRFWLRLLKNSVLSLVPLIRIVISSLLIPAID